MEVLGVFGGASASRSHHLLLQVHQIVNLLFGIEEMRADAQVAYTTQGAH